jgi:TonB family protein
VKRKSIILVIAVVPLLVGVMYAQQNQTNSTPDSKKAVLPEAQLKVIHRVPPIYPPKTKAKGINGIVVVEAVIGKQGDVISARVVEGDEIFWNAAVTAVKAWKFKPLTSQEQETTRIKVGFCAKDRCLPPG